MEFPTLQMNIDYEEGKIKPNRGYPRFVLHPLVRRLEEEARRAYHAVSALAFPSAQSCLYLLLDSFFNPDVKGVYVEEGPPRDVYRTLVELGGRVVPLAPRGEAGVAVDVLEERDPPEKPPHGFTVGYSPGKLKPGDYSPWYDAVITGAPLGAPGLLALYTRDGEAYQLLRRHTGFTPSSRMAARHLRGRTPPSTGAVERVRKKIASLEKTCGDRCLLYSSGMAAVFSAITACWTAERPKLIMLGYPYVDTLSILEKWPSRRGVEDPVFIDDPSNLKMLRGNVDRDTSAVIAEVPTNPLLRIPDLEAVAAIAHEEGARVIVDSTIATPYNLNPFDHDVDVIVHSTTKFLNGLNDHMGGAALTRSPPLLSRLRRLQVITGASMDPADARVLEGNLQGFQERMKRINLNASLVADHLNRHPKVGEVYYPGLKGHPDHSTAVKYMARGFSGLISFVLKNSDRGKAEVFYDNLKEPVVRGPSLGSEQTLLCPYTILAHYHDPPEKRERMGLNLYLFRISVGTEAPARIIGALDEALDHV